MMDINNKFIYVKTKDKFLEILPTIPSGLNPVVFIEDSKQIWTCGTYFSMGDVDVNISEQNGIIKVGIGDDFFYLSTTGDSLSIRKADNNQIIISSSALTKLNTDTVLKWEDVNKKIIHNTSGVEKGTYGPATDDSNVSILLIPTFVVDDYGHLISAGNTTIKIRDYVDQVAPSQDNEERNVLLSYDEASESSSTSQVRKANGLTYNDSSGDLNVSKGGLTVNKDVVVKEGDLVVEKGVIKGDLEGNVSGNATPKIHLSDKPDYGGSSKNLYGHVKLVDDVPESIPNPSSDNDVTTNTNVTAFAASPLMVWGALKAAKDYADNILSEGSGSSSSLKIAGTLIAQNSTIYTPDAKMGELYITEVENLLPCYINNIEIDSGDIFICIKDTIAGNSMNVNTIASNWVIIQSNLIRAISGPDSSIDNQLISFNGSNGKLIKGIPHGSDYQILKIINSVPTWVDENPYIKSIITDVGNITINNEDDVTIIGTNGISVIVKDNKININGLKITAIDNNGNVVNVDTNLKLSNDFIIDSNQNLNLAWEEI